MPQAAPLLPTPAESTRLPNILTLVILVWLAIGLVVFIVRRDWENVFLTFTVIGLIVVPAFVLRRSRVYVPPEFQLIAAAFVFLSLFLGCACCFFILAAVGGGGAFFVMKQQKAAAPPPPAA